MITQSEWQRLLPARPVVPARLWLVVAAVAVAAVNLGFRDEIWPNTPGAYRLWQVVALASVAGLGAELLLVLWRWPQAYAGPRWARFLFRTAVLGLVTGSAFVGGILLLLVSLAMFRG
ncbi:MAG TPA: hypothetical protein VF639_08770 [Hymenobacter sp.]|jgi:hypothetical protein